MNILLISFTFSPILGGVESHLDDLCQALIKRGHKIVVITARPTQRDVPLIERHSDLEIRRISWFPFSLPLFTRLENLPILQVCYLVLPMLIYCIWYLLRKGKNIDVLQVHGFNMAIVGAVLSLLFDKKLIVNTHVSFHLNRKTLYAKLLKIVLGKAVKILVLTNVAKKELTNLGISPEKIIVYHQWIDMRLFEPKDRIKSRKKFAIKKEAFVVCFTGRLIAAKGIDLLLEVADRLDESILLTFVGSGPKEKKIRDFAERGQNVQFIGMIARSDLPYYYSAANICIIPSLQTTKTYAEGIPRVMIEAFSCGTPVAATKTGGTLELINPDVGFFVEPESGSIARFINKFAEEKETLRTMSKRCIQYAREQFDLETNVKIIERSLY